MSEENERSTRADSTWLYWLERCQVLYRDEALLALDKPSGLASHRGWARDEVVAVDLARHYLGGRAHLLHRLDRGASGPLLFAFDPQLARQMCEQFQNQSVEKRYLALVRGHAPDHILVDHPLPNSEGGERVAARTWVRRLAQFERYSLVEARPLSGRLHQVRRHLKHLSLPIIGDANYGKSEHTRIIRERFGLARLALHCHWLSLSHPGGGELRLRSALPQDLADAFSGMAFDPENWARALDLS